MTDDNSIRVRLDSWLWAARFFKTRKLATEAIGGGKVHLRGYRSKPGKPVAIGDEIEITKGFEQWTVIVQGLSSKRGSAPIAATLYQETEESICKREELAHRRKTEFSPRASGLGRPTKRDRRALQKLSRNS